MGSERITAVDKVNLSIPKNTLFGLLGPNGAVLILTLVYIPIGHFSFRTFFDNARRKGALTGY
jgi:ABC-type uncharacterized transport system ATPase subunit